MRYVEYKGGHDDEAACSCQGKGAGGEAKKEASKQQFWLLLNMMMQF